MSHPDGVHGREACDVIKVEPRQFVTEAFEDILV